MTEIPKDLRNNELQELRESARVAARLGGQVLMEWLGRFDVREKNPRDLVTDADLAAQNAIVAGLTNKYPDHVFYGEESQQHERPADDAFCWVIDPLDGTTNYVHGFPHWAVSVAVCRGNEVLAGAIFDPLRDETYSAAAGCGAWLNDKPIAVTSCESLIEALVAVSLPATVTLDSADMLSMNRLAVQCRALRRTGSAALNLAYLAAGRLDAFSASQIQAWDVAAGILLVREAGGTVTARDGGEFRLYEANFAAAATLPLHQQYCDTLKTATPGTPD